jgi:hypothetical protein
MPELAGFLSPLRLEDTNGPPYVLCAPLVYASRAIDRIVRVPIGFQTDLASIPRWLWSVVPKSGAYDRPAVVHDWLYYDGGGGLTRGQADAVLTEAMVSCRVAAYTRIVLAAGVRLGGGQAWARYRAGEGMGRSHV